MLLRSRSLGAAIALLAALPSAGAAAVPAARPSIVPQVSIRGVAVGMTPAEVRAALGAPNGSGISQSPILGKVRIWRYAGLRISFDSVNAGRTVVTVTTTSRRDRAAGDVGVGSPESAVQHAVPGVVCATRLGYRTCMVGSQRAGQLVTDFAISGSGRVSRVTLGRVID